MVPGGYTARKEEPLTLHDSEPEPDIFVVRGSDDDFTKAHPTSASLLVAVAVSSTELDRELAFLYAEAGVEEYWIVLGFERVVEVYRRPVGGAYQEKTTVSAGELLTCKSVPGVAVQVGELFS